MKHKYITPDITIDAFECEAGFSLSTNIGGWESGGSEEGEAE